MALQSKVIVVLVIAWLATSGWLLAAQRGLEVENLRLGAERDQAHAALASSRLAVTALQGSLQITQSELEAQQQLRVDQSRRAADLAHQLQIQSRFLDQERVEVGRYNRALFEIIAANESYKACIQRRLGEPGPREEAGAGHCFDEFHRRMEVLAGEEGGGRA